MAHYLLAYLGGEPPATPEEGRRHMVLYQSWLSALGPAVISPANPLRNTCTVTPDGRILPASTTNMSGYTIIEAASMDAALEIARDCPFLQVGGTLEVSEMITMPVGL